MTKIEVFDPPMCCTSGVCGPEPDAQLSSFAADLKWLQGQGVEVRRFNLAQEPYAFVTNANVKRIVDATDGDGLPIVLINGQVASQGEYPYRERLLELAGIDAQATAAEPAREAMAVEQPLLFNERVAELVALGAAIAANCEPCFKYHHRKAGQLGIARDDMIQAVNVALQVKDQPARATMRVAQQLLAPEVAESGGCCGGDGGGACC
jgi:AhpD family alkylhydroperoxidase